MVTQSHRKTIERRKRNELAREHELLTIERERLKKAKMAQKGHKMSLFEKDFTYTHYPFRPLVYTEMTHFWVLCKK